MEGKPQLLQVIGFWDVTMAIIKYDKDGNKVKTTELVGTQLNPTTYSEGGGDWTYGTYLPFSTNANCSLTINDGIIACFFGRQMFNNHQSSMMFFVDADTLEYVSNRYYTTEENVEKYTEPGAYYTSHSLGQRIIPVSDGGYLSVELGDAGYNGATRGLMVTRIYPQNNILKVSKNKMVNFSEGGKGSHGYNYTYSSLGNLIELDDGYMYIGSMEKSLRLNYGNSINESWNIFAQKYSKDFYTKDNVEDMQMFKTEVRTTTGTPPEDASLGVNASQGRIYLRGSEKDYGIKWLTDQKNETITVLLRAVKIENNNIAIIWEESPIEEYSDSNYLIKKDESNVYYMIIDSNANIVTKPTIVPSVKMNEEEQYVYKDGKIHWTTTSGNTAEIQVNVLDVKNPIKALKGDVNYDTKVNLYDALQILKQAILGGTLTDDMLYIMDYNDDENVNLYDALKFLQQAILG